MRTKSRELLAVGIFGNKSSIGDRIEMLLRHSRIFSPRASATAVAASAIILSGLLLLASLTPRWIAFAQPALPSFEVASIKPSPPMSARGVFFGMSDDPDRFKGSYVTLTDLMAKAYGVEHARISGGPSWVLSDRFDVIATLPTATPEGQIPLLLQNASDGAIQADCAPGYQNHPRIRIGRGKRWSKVEAIRGGRQRLARRASHAVFGPSPDGLEWRIGNLLWQGKAQQDFDGRFRHAPLRGDRSARAGCDRNRRPIRDLFRMDSGWGAATGRGAGRSRSIHLHRGSGAARAEAGAAQRSIGLFGDRTCRKARCELNRGNCWLSAS
jgi:hypothetical protein